MKRDLEMVAIKIELLMTSLYDVSCRKILQSLCDSKIISDEEEKKITSIIQGE
jgi:hypothetical protein